MSIKKIVNIIKKTGTKIRDNFAIFSLGIMVFGMFYSIIVPDRSLPNTLLLGVLVIGGLVGMTFGIVFKGGEVPKN